MSFLLRINSPFWTWEAEQATPHPNPADIIFTSESPDFNRRTILLNNNVGGEVRIHRPYLVMEAQCNTLDHGLYVTTDSVNSSQFFSASHHLSTQNFFLFLPRRLSSALTWLRSLRRALLGPFTRTVLPFRVMSTFSGMSLFFLLRIDFILAVDAAKVFIIVLYLLPK